LSREWYFSIHQLRHYDNGERTQNSSQFYHHSRAPYCNGLEPRQADAAGEQASQAASNAIKIIFITDSIAPSR
jgi:hypothetical protein